MPNRNTKTSSTVPRSSFYWTGVGSCWGSRAGNCLTKYTEDYLFGTVSPLFPNVLRQNALDRRYLQYTLRPAEFSIWVAYCGVQKAFSSLTYPNNGFYGYFTSDMQYVTDRVGRNIRRELNSVSINAAELFATRRQTINMVANTAARLAGMYRSLRGGRNPFTGHNCDGSKASQLWLEHAYGWTPLLSDIHTLIERETFKSPDFIVKKRCRKNVSKTLSFSLANSDWPQFSADTVWQAFGYVNVSCMAKIRVKDPSLAANTQLGLTNPALLAWELLPYSFVVDWFLPVGEWLELQTALMGIDVLEVSTTSTYYLHGNGQAKKRASYPSYPYYSLGDVKGSGLFKEVKKVRTGALPALMFPKLKNPFSVQHALNAIALLTTAFGRKSG